MCSVDTGQIVITREQIFRELIQRLFNFGSPKIQTEDEGIKCSVENPMQQKLSQFEM